VDFFITSSSDTVIVSSTFRSQCYQVRVDLFIRDPFQIPIELLFVC